MSTSASSQDLDHFRDRVRLYLGVMLAIDLGFEASGLILPLFVADAVPPPGSPWFKLLGWGTILCLGGGWLFARYGRPGRTALIALEASVTLILTLFYVFLTRVVPFYGPAFAMLCTLLALVVRSAVVPSTVTRTLVVGGIAVALVAVSAARELAESAPPIAVWLTMMGVGFVVATAVTSRVIYGLRRQVRNAMRLGQYELGRKLGEGGMGVVYQATHVMLRRPTAVKLLPIERAGAQTIARFEREVQQTSRLEHPNSVSIYDYGRTPDGQFYYAMEYLEGLTLERLVELDGPQPEARVQSILLQAASALAEAHALGLVHRDVKPANVMLCQRAGVPDTVKVLDFGLVKAVDQTDGNGSITRENAIVGTPQYLAPEAISQPDAVKPPADVYALGALAFFLVTGRDVFTGRTVIEICSKHLSDAPEAPSAVLGRPLDPRFEGLILRCLAKSPEDRPKDGAALASELATLKLGGWTAEDARAFWRNAAARSARATDQGTPVKTELAIDLEARSAQRPDGERTARAAQN